MQSAPAGTLLLVLLSAALLVPGTGCGDADEADAAGGPLPAEIGILCPNSNTGLSSATCQAVAAALEELRGRPVPVQHHPPLKNGMLKGKAAPADGSTLVYFTVELAMFRHATGRELQGFPTRDDFELLCLLNGGPAAVVVRADGPWPDLQSFVADAKARPGRITVGTSKKKAIWHLAAVYFGRRTGTEFTIITHEDGAGEAVTKLRSKSGLEAVMVSPAEVKDGLEQGDLRMLAVMDETRAKLYPAVPTVEEALGVKVRLSAWGGLCVPKGTPAAARAELTALLAKAAASETFLARVAQRDLVPDYRDGAALDAFFAEEEAKFEELMPLVE